MLPLWSDAMSLGLASVALVAARPSPVYPGIPAPDTLWDPANKVATPEEFTLTTMSWLL